MTSVDRIQGLSGSLAAKTPCRVATTANITLSGEQTIDAVAVVDGDRVLVKNQTDTTENGIYNVSTGHWTRSLDFDGANDLVQGTAVAVQQGTTNGETIWKVTTSSPVIGSALAFDQLVPGDASTVEYTQVGTGAVATTVQARLRETVSVKDFGAVGDGVTNDTTAINLALAAVTDNSTLVFPMGDYIVTVASLSFGGKTIHFDLSSGATLNGDVELLTTGNAVTEYRNVVPAAVGWNYHEQLIHDSRDAGAYKVDGENITMYTGGSTVKGGRHALEATVYFYATSNAANADRNYVGIAAVALSSANDNGTDHNDSSTAAGALFGANLVARLETGATHWLNLSGAEVNVEAATGSSVWYKSGIQIVAEADDAVQGTDYDAALSISSFTGAVGWKTGILFSSANGQHPLAASGTLIATAGSDTVAYGIDLSSYAFSTGVFKSSGILIDGSGNISLTSSNASLELGARASANTPFIDFNSSGNSYDYDVRLIASGGVGYAGNGTLTVAAGSLVVPVDSRFVNALGDYADDVAAAAGGIQIKQVYRTGSALKVRVS